MEAVFGIDLMSVLALVRSRAGKGCKLALRREGPLLHGAGMLDHVIPILKKLVRELTIALLVLGRHFRFFDNDRR